MKLHAFFLFLHLMATVVWVGGMFFAHVCLRPAAMETLQPPQRLALWQGVFARFFPWVAVAIALTLLSGFGMIHRSGFAAMPAAWHAMMDIGLVMIAIFLSIIFGPYRHFRQAMAASDLAAAASAQGKIRLRVLINLILGISNLAIATLGLAI